MSRVHDALRRAEKAGAWDPNQANTPVEEPIEAAQTEADYSDGIPVAPETTAHARAAALQTRLRSGGGFSAVAGASDIGVDWPALLDKVREVPLEIAPEAHLISPEHPHEVPAEEFRSLRTRLNHLQTQQALHTLVVTSASPAEGKTFTAVNLALAEAQLAENPVLLIDLDLRRPVVHNLFRVERSPGFSDFMSGAVPLDAAMRKIGSTNLYFMPSGSPVKNPLELLNLRRVRQLFDELPTLFNWVVIDSPPLLFSADANLLSTLCDGTIMVVRIGATTYDNVIRAMQSLCENNVLGIVANGARATELYSKYTYYYSKHE